MAEAQEMGAQLMAWLGERLRGGLPMMQSAAALAQSWRARAGDLDPEARLRAMVRHELRKTFSVGVVMGLGASVAAPVGVPGAVAAAWLLQARLAAAIACLRGHRLEDADVQADVLQCLVGATAPESVRQASVHAGEWLAGRAIGRIGARGAGPLRALFGRRLAALGAGGGGGAVRMGRVVPVIGALVGGGVDALSARRVARRALAAFPPASPPG